MAGQCRWVKRGSYTRYGWLEKAGYLRGGTCVVGGDGRGHFVWSCSGSGWKTKGRALTVVVAKKQACQALNRKGKKR